MSSMTSRICLAMAVLCSPALADGLEVGSSYQESWITLCNSAEAGHALTVLLLDAATRGEPAEYVKSDCLRRPLSFKVVRLIETIKVPNKRIPRVFEMDGATVYAFEIVQPPALNVVEVDTARGLIYLVTDLPVHAMKPSSTPKPK